MGMSLRDRAMLPVWKHTIMVWEDMFDDLWKFQIAAVRSVSLVVVCMAVLLFPPLAIIGGWWRRRLDRVECMSFYGCETWNEYLAIDKGK